MLAALQATALAYLAEDGGAIPFWRMASLTVDQLRERADAYGVGEIVDVMSTPGGGTLPGVEIPSVGVAVEGDQREALRELDHPIIARVDHGDSSAGETTVLDLRTIHPDDDEVVAGAPLAPERHLMHVVATAGHVDHGKSTLIKALTGTDPDRLEEEKARGLTIDLGFAGTKLPSGRGISFIDVPGHVRFLKNMLAGVGGVDACIFVVAATEGWKPQSEEHLRILSLLGIRHGIVALTKVGHVDDELATIAQMEIADRTEGTFLADAPIVPVDAIEGHGIDDLNTALDQLLDVTPTARDDKKPASGSTACSRPRAPARSSPARSPAGWCGLKTSCPSYRSTPPSECGRCRVSTPTARRSAPATASPPTSPASPTTSSGAVTCSCGLTTGMSPARSTPVFECSNRSTGQ